MYATGVAGLANMHKSRSISFVYKTRTRQVGEARPGRWLTTAAVAAAAASPFSFLRKPSDCQTSDARLKWKTNKNFCIVAKLAFFFFSKQNE